MFALSKVFAHYSEILTSSYVVGSPEKNDSKNYYKGYFSDCNDMLHAPSL